MSRSELRIFEECRIDAGRDWSLFWFSDLGLGVNRIKGVSALRSLRIVVFTSKEPWAVAQLVSRIHREVPEAQLSGIVYESLQGHGIFHRDLAKRLRRGLVAFFEGLATAVLRFIHACPGHLNDPTQIGLEDLSRSCEAIGCSMVVTSDLLSREVLEFVRKLRPDLGIIYGTRNMAPELFAVPGKGCVLLRKGRALDCSDTREPGCEELLEGQQRIEICVLHFETRLENNSKLKATAIPIGPYDTQTSLALKLNLIGNDLLVRVAADYAGSKTQGGPPECCIGDIAIAEPQAQVRDESQITPSRPRYKAPRGRPVWNLLLRTVLSSPWVVSRNWFRRLRGSAPVIILFHHLVSDRPHHLGIPTDHLLKHVEFLKRHYRIASLSEAVEGLKTRCLKVPTVVLTFDDGYLENFINLRAVAQETAIPATLFVCTGHVSQRQEFGHDRKRQQHGFPPLTWEQIDYLGRNGFEIGSHTRSHFDCGSTDLAALEREILGSKADLEQRLGRSVKFFSFPWGQPANMSPEAVQLAKATYPYVFSAYGGVNLPARDSTSCHLLRSSHISDLWELELELQSMLD